MDVLQYTQHDATGLVELIRGGQVSAAEVQRAACEASASGGRAPREIKE